MSGIARIPISSSRYDASTASLTTAWRTMVTGLAADTYEAELFNGTGEFCELGIGSTTANAVALNYTIIPGGPDGRVGMIFNQGMNVYLRCISTAASGVFVANLLR